jgi:TonB family protein
MYIDFEDYRPSTPTLGSAISRREGILLSIIGHLVFVILILTAPRLPFFQQMVAEQEKQAELARKAELERQRQEQRFVFVQPRRDIKALRPPPTSALSDENRVARAPERAEHPTNRLPYSRGNSPNMVEALPRSEANARPPAEPEVEQNPGEGNAAASVPFQGRLPSPSPQSPAAGAGTGTGSLRDALQNLQKFVQNENFSNPTGDGGSPDPSIQFDTKGVDFGSWIRRFVAQIKRNWFIPYAAMALKGNVVLTFNVHKNGAITDLSVHRPSTVDAFTNSAYNALLSSNPTQPLPPEYPADKAFFTVTFYYNEAPPQTP